MLRSSLDCSSKLQQAMATSCRGWRRQSEGQGDARRCQEDACHREKANGGGERCRAGQGSPVLTADGGGHSEIATAIVSSLEALVLGFGVREKEEDARYI